MIVDDIKGHQEVMHGSVRERNYMVKGILGKMSNVNNS